MYVRLLATQWCTMLTWNCSNVVHEVRRQGICRQVVLG
ncbi:hypothetical protein LINPERHAP1_LOCUS8663 [Linum perenne]